METRVCNSLIIGIILFLVILLIKKNELFTSTTSPVVQKEKILNPVQNLSKLLNNGDDNLKKLQKGLQNQSDKIKTFINNNNYLTDKISKEKSTYENLINQNNKIKNEILTRIVSLSKKKGIKNPQEVVDQLMTKNGLK